MASVDLCIISQPKFLPRKGCFFWLNQSVLDLRFLSPFHISVCWLRRQRKAETFQNRIFTSIHLFTKYRGLQSVQIIGEDLQLEFIKLAAVRSRSDFVEKCNKPLSVWESNLHFPLHANHPRNWGRRGEGRSGWGKVKYQMYYLHILASGLVFHISCSEH